MTEKPKPKNLKIVDTETINFILTYWDNMNQGASMAINLFKIIFERGISGKSKLSADELKLLIDVMHGTKIDKTWLSNNALISQVEDDIDIDNLDEKWNVEKTILLSKLSDMHPIQSFSVALWAWLYWYGKKPVSDIDDYISNC